MTEDPFAWLRCPHCGAALHREEAALRCPQNHAFDVARQGYVNLLGRAAPRNADTPEMLDARARFLRSGHFDPIADSLVAATGGARRVVEVGAGTGHYLARVLDALPHAAGLATDVSTAAAKRAARAHPRAVSVVADTWAGLPLCDAVADAVLCVFAPRNPSEFTRILRPDGRVVVVVPMEDHLQELRDRYGLLAVGDDKVEGVLAAFAGWDATVSRIRFEMALRDGQGADLVAMGPNAFHSARPEVEDLPCTASVAIIGLTRSP